MAGLSQAARLGGASNLDLRLERDDALTLDRGDIRGWQGALLGAIVLASTLPYVGRLGFYSDDWGFLGTLATAADQSFLGLWAAQWQHVNTQARPTQVLTQVLLYQSFGVNPLAYHVANALLLAALGVLLWRVLRQVGVHRQVAFAVPAVALLLPHASTNRFWFAAFGYAISVATYLASLQCALRALEPHRARRWPWSLGALVMAGVCAFGYELTLPALVLLTPTVLWWYSRREWPRGVKTRMGGPGAAGFFATYYGVLGIAVAYKLVFAHGAGTDLYQLGRLFVGSAVTNLGTYGLALPDTLATAAVTGGPVAVAGGLLLGAATYLGMRGVAADGPALPVDAGSRRSWGRLVLLGCGIYVLGVSLFLVTARFGMTSTGVGNRMAMGWMFGIAIVIVAACGALATAFGRRSVRERVFPILVAVTCAGASLVTLAIAEHWVAAWPRQQEVIEGVDRALGGAPENLTVVVSGVCPYVGPGVVFDSYWDVTGALQVHFEEPTIAGDAAVSELTVEPEGLRTVIYGVPTTYPYRPGLVGYDHPTGTVDALTDERDARAFFGGAQAAWPEDCPPGEPGHGARVFRTDRLYHAIGDLLGARR